MKIRRLLVTCHLSLPVRILHISSAKALGGGERHLAALVLSLDRRGHDVHVALTPRSPLLERLGKLPSQNIIEMNLRHALDVNSARRLAHLVRERQIEIVHAHMGRDYPLASFATVRNRQARLIITRHVLFPLNRLHTLTLSHVSRVIAVSKAVAHSLLKQKIFPEHKISIVPNGIDFQSFDAAAHNFNPESFRREMKIAPESLLIGTVGEINPLKGHEEFLRAAALIISRFPNTEFIIAGQDTSRTGEHMAAVKRLIRELHLEGRVHLTGWLENVAPLLCALDLFVSASHTESFGLAIAEAMASGTPVVATDTEGAQEIINDETGVLVPIGDAGALAASIISLLEDDSRRARLGALGRERVRERFSLERMVTATEQIYEQVLQAKH